MPGPMAPAITRARAALSSPACASRRPRARTSSAGVSIDQVVANQIGHLTRFASLELTCDVVRKSGDCDSGYACAYEYNLAWQLGQPAAGARAQSAFVFERLFGDGAPQRARREPQAPPGTSSTPSSTTCSRMRSQLNAKLDGRDRQKLDQYLTSVREIEQRIENSKSMPVQNPDVDAPAGVPDSYAEHVALMFDMLHARLPDRLHAHRHAAAGARRQQPPLQRHRHFVGPPRSHAPQEQRRDHREGEAHRSLVRAALRARSSRRWSTTEDVDGQSLLHHSMILYGSGNADGNRHTHDNLPIVLAGAGGGAFKPGRFVKAKEPAHHRTCSSAWRMPWAPQPSRATATPPAASQG